ncbi:MAG TPA: hypothetical protein VK203_29390 [Nostocaceae cyanobacterium]|nr:hypothetical protein [Nostocaceae cyanobacterium]
MPSRFKQSIILSSTAAIALLFAGCGESKVAQCNKITKVANQAAQVSQQEGKNAQTKKDSASFKKFASKIDEITTELKAIEVKDEKLQGFQTRFVTVYQDLSQGLKDTAVAIDKKNAKAINSILTKMQKTSNDETSLVKEINSYCTGS